MYVINKKKRKNHQCQNSDRMLSGKNRMPDVHGERTVSEPTFCFSKMSFKTHQKGR